VSDTYVIDTVFKAHDQLSSTVQKVSERMGMFGRVSDRNFKKASSSALHFKTVLGGVLGANLLSAGLGRLRQGITAITDEFIDFDHAVTSAAAKWDIDRGTDAFRELGTVVRDVAKVTPYTAGEAGKALDYLAMAGFSAKDSMAALPGVTQLAIAAQTDLARSSDIASDLLTAFGMKVENLTELNDVLAKTTTTSNTNLDMLFESMKLVAPVAGNLGGSLEEVSAMLGTLANSGIKASLSGTSLKNMYLRLTGGTREVEKVLKKYNIRVADQHGKMRSLIDILEDTKNATAKLTDKERQAALTHLFGNRAIAGATILMKAGSKATWEYARALEGSNGAAAEMAERMGKSFQNRIASIKSRFVELGIKVFDIFEKQIPQAFDSFTEALDNIDVVAFVDNIKSAVKFVKDYHGLIEGLIATIVIYNTVTKIAAAVQWALNIAMMANPIGLVIVLVTALGVAIYGLIRYGDEVKAFFDKLWGDIAYGFMWLLDKISFGNIEKVAGKGAAETFEKMKKQRKALEEIDRRKGYKSTAEKVGEQDIAALAGESATSKAFDDEVGDIFSKYSTSADLENETMKEKQLSSNLSNELLFGKQNVNVGGTFTFENAPKGMNFTPAKGAPNIDIQGLGQQ